MSQWEHRAQHPELDNAFNGWIKQGTAHLAEAILAVYDFSPYRTILDVGGGKGALLAAILRNHPDASGILFDQQHLAAQGRSYLETAGVASRCRIEEGSFLDRIPVEADAIVLKNVIHDWDDEQGLAILKNAKKALHRDGALLLIERIASARVEHGPAVIMEDLHMLAMTGGRERSEAEYRGLLKEAGLTVTGIISAAYGLSIMEAAHAGSAEKTDRLTDPA